MRTFRTPARLPLLLSIGTFLWVAAANAARPETQDMRMAGYPEPGAPPIVTLLSPGAEPRTRLRCTPPRNAKARAELRMQMGITMGMEGASMPTVDLPVLTIGLDMAVTGIAANGDITVTSALTGVSVQEGPGVDPAMAAQMRALDADYKTVHGATTMTDRGIVRTSTFDISQVSNPQVKQMMESMSQTMQGMAMPLPDEAVGVGAQWEVRQSLNAGGMQTFQKTTLEVVAVQGKTLTLKTRTEQTAPPQALHLPQIPAGADIALTKLTGSGTSTMTTRLDELVPVSESNVRSDATMEITMAGQTQTVTTVTTIKVSIAAVK